MKHLSAIFTACALLAAALPALAGEKTIYGSDNRAEFYEAVIPVVRAALPAAVSLFMDTSLSETAGGYKIKSVTLGHESRRFCPGQRFLDQPVAAFCSGTLVAPDLVLTAGHCMGRKDQPPSRCGRTRFVFGYNLASAGSGPRAVARDDVYSCAMVDAYKFDGSGDYALVRLDRPVRGRRPAVARRAPPEPGEPLFAIGGPYGLPLKVLEDAHVRSVNPAHGSFVTNLDASTGNSGGGVFSAVDGRLIGVHVASADSDRVYIPLPPGHGLPPGDARVLAGKCQVISVFAASGGSGKLAYALAAVPGFYELIGAERVGEAAAMPPVGAQASGRDLSRFGLLP